MESTIEPPSLPPAQIAEEMVPFTMPSALRMVGCMTTENTTPPASPKETSFPSTKSPTTARFKFARLVTKHPESTRTTKKLRRSRPLRQQNVASADYRTPDKPMVSRIETPYPFILPESPISMEDDDKYGSHLPQLELRRVSSSYRDLRAVAQVQNNHLNLPSRSHPQTPLLPSPIIDDRIAKDATTPDSYFKAKQETPFAIKRKDRTYRSYEDLHILSCYDDQYVVSQEDLGRSNVAALASARGDDDFHNIDSSSASPTSAKTSIASSNSSINSPESGWLANTTSHDERQQRFKARCYQVVQHSCQSERPAQEPDEKIMLATVLVGRRKPKIVQIQRPSSSNNSVRSKESLARRQTCSPPIFEMPAPPTTPVHQQKEISAFSPYDTPSNFTPFTDLSYTACVNVKPKLHEPIYSDSKLDLIPMPLSTSRDTSSIPNGSVRSDGDDRINPNADPFEILDADVDDAPIWLARSMTNNTNWMKDLSRGSVMQSSPTDNIAAQSKYRKLDRGISLITKAIDAFPGVMLRLDSPAILALRSCPTHQVDQQLIGAFKDVFPTAPKQLLSALAAWVIVDSFFANLERFRPQSTTSIGRTFSQRMFPVPASKHGQFNTAIPSSTNQSQSRHLPARSSTTPIPYSFDESLHSIPSKARNVLGIDSEVNIRLLLTQAKALQPSIGIVAQRLLDIVRGSDTGSSTWDPALWRALSVTVKLIEDPHSSNPRSNVPPTTSGSITTSTFDTQGDQNQSAGSGSRSGSKNRKGSRDPASTRTSRDEEEIPARDTIDMEKRLGFGDGYPVKDRDPQNWV